VVAQQPPALAGLAADISFASLSLSIERGEGKVEVMFGRIAGADRATQIIDTAVFIGFASLEVDMRQPRRDRIAPSGLITA
jgi:hypothetical protein